MAKKTLPRSGMTLRISWPAAPYPLLDEGGTRRSTIGRAEDRKVSATRWCTGSALACGVFRRRGPFTLEKPSERPSPPDQLSARSFTIFLLCASILGIALSIAED